MMTSSSSFSLSKETDNKIVFPHPLIVDKPEEWSVPVILQHSYVFANKMFVDQHLFVHCQVDKKTCQEQKLQSTLLKKMHSSRYLVSGSNYTDEEDLLLRKYKDISKKFLQELSQKTFPCMCLIELSMKSPEGEEEYPVWVRVLAISWESASNSLKVCPIPYEIMGHLLVSSGWTQENMEDELLCFCSPINFDEKGRPSPRILLHNIKIRTESTGIRETYEKAKQFHQEMQCSLSVKPRSQKAGIAPRGKSKSDAASSISLSSFSTSITESNTQVNSVLPCFDINLFHMGRTLILSEDQKKQFLEKMGRNNKLLNCFITARVKSEEICQIMDRMQIDASGE